MTKIIDWLNYKKRNSNFTFDVIDVTEKKKIDDEIIAFLQERIILSYRPIEFYKFHFGDNLIEDEIKSYLIDQILPKDENNIDKNVRQGDWGETFAELVVSQFTKLNIPITKLKWKFNKNKSVFATDLIAFNDSDTIKDIYYYEIKTRYNPDKKEGIKPNRYFIPAIAHQNLVTDVNSPTESIFNFLEMYYYEKADFKSANKYKELVKKTKRFNKKFEIFLILEKNKFQEKILDELEKLPPALNPLNVTIVLINNLQELVTNTWNKIENALVSKLSEKKNI